MGVDSLDRAEVDDQRKAGDAPCTLEAVGECDPRQAGRQSELQVCDLIGDHSYYGDTEYCVVLR